MPGVDGVPGTLAGVLRDDELILLAELHRHPPTFAVDDLAGDVQVEVPEADAVVDRSHCPRYYAVEG